MDPPFASVSSATLLQDVALTEARCLEKKKILRASLELSRKNLDRDLPHDRTLKSNAGARGVLRDLFSLSRCSEGEGEAAAFAGARKSSLLSLRSLGIRSLTCHC